MNTLALALLLNHPVRTIPWFEKTFLTRQVVEVDDEVRLYYYPSAVRLMQTLRPNCDITPASSTAVTPSGKTTEEALAEHANALSKLSAFISNAEALKVIVAEKKRVLGQATEAQASAQSDKESKDAAVTAADNRLKKETLPSHYDPLIAEAKTDFETKQAAYTKCPAEPSEAKATKKKEMDEAKKVLDEFKKLQSEAVENTKGLQEVFDKAKVAAGIAEKELSTANGAKEDATDALTAAESNLSAEVARETGLRTGLETATNNLRTARLTDRKREQTDVLEFAKKRDTQALLKLSSNGGTNPVDKVTITAYADERVLHIRGSREDVDKVKEIIAVLDAPAPQAKVTLWNLEVNYTGGRGRNALSEKIFDVDREMNAAREEIALITNTFRSAVAQQVQFVEQRNLENFMVRARNQSSAEDLNPGLFARFCYYQPDVAQQLGFDSVKAQTYAHYFYFAQWMLPDPAATTTLGESIFIFMLGAKEHRQAIWKNFIASVSKKGCDVERFRATLGISKDDQVSPYEGMTGDQLEIVRALKRNALDRLIERSRDVAGITSSFNSKFPHFSRQLLETGPVVAKPEFWQSEFYEPTAAARKMQRGIRRYNQDGPERRSAIEEDLYGDKKGTHQETSELLEKRGIATSMAYLFPALSWFRREFGIGFEYFPGLAKRAGHVNNLTQGQAAQWMRQVFPTSASNARIAAADEMLKRTMIALEDDLYDNVVQPHLAKIQIAFKQKGLQLGSVERTSILATNRFNARVKPSATVQLDLSGQEKVLDEAIKLGDIISATKSEALIGGITKLKEKAANDVPDPLTMYAVNSGSEFTITPIFDPSGQAFRFQFDYLKATRVSDPDGTEPALPRVDTHGVNALVQVSNLEIREISRFSTNVKLGVNSRTTGGLPLINKIPGLQDIPLIGYFSKTNGREAAAQTSIIYAQAAVYPTIGALGSLMTGGAFIPPFATDK